MSGPDVVHVADVLAGIEEIPEVLPWVSARFRVLLAEDVLAVLPSHAMMDWLTRHEAGFPAASDDGVRCFVVRRRALIRSSRSL